VRHSKRSIGRLNSSEGELFLSILEKPMIGFDSGFGKSSEQIKKFEKPPKKVHILRGSHETELGRPDFWTGDLDVVVLC
jgi:hypothetical protein